MRKTILVTLEMDVEDTPMSAEHVAQADSCQEVQYHRLSFPEMTWDHEPQHRNFRGWRQYRAMIPGEAA